MAVRPKVVDASAVAALLFAEPKAEAIAESLGNAPLVAPTLLPYEVSSVCLKKLGRYPDQRAALLEGLSLLNALSIRLSGVPESEVVALAELESITSCDAAYLWLARALGCDLVTLDRKLQRASSRAAPTPGRQRKPERT